MNHHLIWTLGDIFTVLISLGIPATVIVLVVKYNTRRKNQRDKLKAELMAKAIEHGQTLPENLFAEPKKQNQRDKFLPAGIINIASGLGLSLILWLVVDIPNIWSIGILPFLVGIALLIIHFLEKKSQPTENETK